MRSNISFRFLRIPLTSIVYFIFILLLQRFIGTTVQDTHESVCCFVVTNVHQTHFKYR